VAEGVVASVSGPARIATEDAMRAALLPLTALFALLVAMPRQAPQAGAAQAKQALNLSA
jgi:hypothetical protein